jgi:hypothetical protein
MILTTVHAQPVRDLIAFVYQITLVACRAASVFAQARERARTKVLSSRKPTLPVLHCSAGLRHQLLWLQRRRIYSHIEYGSVRTYVATKKRTITIFSIKKRNTFSDAFIFRVDHRDALRVERVGGVHE